MSHLAERKQKNCLNCGTEVVGRFCHVCGQENTEPKETVWHLITHFFNDITHFDGKFFTSLKDLLFKPGFLSREYTLGRRSSYLNPIRMYLFTSALFFLVFFSLFKFNDNTINNSITINGRTIAEVDKMDSAAFATYTKEINKINKKIDTPLTRQEFAHYADSLKNTGLSFTGKHYKSKEEYDSVLRSGKNHNWFERQMIYKEIELNKKYNNNTGNILRGLRDQFMHSIPQMLFVLLPLFAIILKLVYIRRKQFYYVDHVIFTTHLYIFVFLTMLVIFGVDKINSLLQWRLLGYVSAILIISIFFYFYKALRNFYKQRRAKTILKFIILLLLFFLAALILFVLFGFFSLFSL